MGSSPSPAAQTVLVCALIGTAQMTWGVTVPVLPLYLSSYGMAVGLLGTVVAAFAVGRVIANVPAGLALRRLPPRRYLWSVMLALSAVTALTGLAHSAPALLAIRLVAGLFGGAAVTVGFALLIAGAPPGRRGAALATATVVQMSAGAAGSVLGGAIVGVIGPAWTFPVAALPALACLLWDAARPATLYWSAPVGRPAPRSPGAPAAMASGRHLRFFGDVGRLTGQGYTGGLLVALCAVSFATFLVRFAGEQGLIPVLAYDSGGLTPFTLGLATAAGTLVSLGAMPLIGRSVDRGARNILLIPAGIAGAVALLALPLLRVPAGFGAAIVLYSLATSVIGVLPGVVAGDAYPAEATGAVIGLTRTAGDIGAAVGPVGVFAVAALAGYPAAGALLAALFLVAAAWLAVAIRPTTGRQYHGDRLEPALVHARSTSAGT
ncbi:MFS transporter [Actinoplanes sp. NPDC051851]|uniref:MFS transporter n=1 Tax=Actinoplanes sp. NPDC051851 TaxID=3154753 RepID=UPI003449524F